MDFKDYLLKVTDVVITNRLPREQPLYFRRATGLGVYDYAGGLDEFGVIDFCNRIKNVSRP